MYNEIPLKICHISCFADWNTGILDKTVQTIGLLEENLYTAYTGIKGIKKSYTVGNPICETMCGIQGINAQCTCRIIIGSCALTSDTLSKPRHLQIMNFCSWKTVLQQFIYYLRSMPRMTKLGQGVRNWGMLPYWFNRYTTGVIPDPSLFWTTWFRIQIKTLMDPKIQGKKIILQIQKAWKST